MNCTAALTAFIPTKQYLYSSDMVISSPLSSTSSHLQKNSNFMTDRIGFPLHLKEATDDEEIQDGSRGERFKPNKPISLPSLENPPDAGPLYNTCKSVTGTEMQQQGMEQENEKVEPFVPNKAIELDSLQDIDRSFLGLQPRSDNGASLDDSEVPLLMETGLGVFTSSVILGGSVLFIVSVFLDDGNSIDPTMIPLSF